MGAHQRRNIASGHSLKQCRGHPRTELLGLLTQVGIKVRPVAWCLLSRSIFGSWRDVVIQQRAAGAADQTVTCRDAILTQVFACRDLDIQALEMENALRTSHGVLRRERGRILKGDSLRILSWSTRCALDSWIVERTLSRLTFIGFSRLGMLSHIAL